ncbi:MAG: hypothetical protein Q8942_17015, partial [Bacillota bacterium]|nr:hypothetical protein [Bacillota bacterium]
MKRQKFAISMALSILMITVFISATGFLSMSVFLNGRVPPDIRVGHTDIGGLNKQEAVQKIEESYENTIKDDFINISYNTGNINKDFRV